MHDVLIGFGSNLGDRKSTIQAAWLQIAQIEGVEAARLSTLYETKPVGGPLGQPNYLNAVALLRTFQQPEWLLRRLQEIENRFGRVRREHWGARTLDLDILLFGNVVVTTPKLTIPHPMMSQRLFVLRPAAEVAPQMQHPLSRLTIVEMLASNCQKISMSGSLNQNRNCKPPFFLSDDIDLITSQR